MNLVKIKRNNLEKFIRENIIKLHQYFGKHERYNFVKNMDIEIFEEQLIQWIFNVRDYIRKYSNCRFYLVDILDEFVKIENIKHKYHLH